MNAGLQTVIAASDAERRDLILGATTRLGTAVQNVEKDFRICSTRDALFNGLPADAATRDALERDYVAMSGMIFDATPSLDTVLASVMALQDAIKATGALNTSAPPPP